MPSACACRRFRSRLTVCWTLSKRREAKAMRAFEYVSPDKKEQAVSLLSSNWDEALPLAGGTDLLALMKDDIVTPKRLVNIKDIREMRGLDSAPKKGLRI